MYKCGNAGPELIADEWSKLPPDATPVWDKSRFAGQPLVAPHADDAERWLAMEDALAHVSWHLQGAKDGTLDSVKASVTRCELGLLGRTVMSRIRAAVEQRCPASMLCTISSRLQLQEPAAWICKQCGSSDINCSLSGHPLLP